MDNVTLVAVVSIVTSGATTAAGCITPAFSEGRSVSAAMAAMAQQPDAANAITRALFAGLAMIESIAIYCFVVSMILIFANPFWNQVVGHALGK
jgi:F-type H+-transporting ATPase subunit c